MHSRKKTKATRPEFVNKASAKVTNCFAMQRKHHKSTLERIRKVRAIVDRYYEAGNNSKCYKAVWQRYVCPLYPMSYRTFLSYLDIPTPPPPPPTALEQSLFEFWDDMPVYGK